MWPSSSGCCWLWRCCSGLWSAGPGAAPALPQSPSWVPLSGQKPPSIAPGTLPFPSTKAPLGPSLYPAPWRKCNQSPSGPRCGPGTLRTLSPTPPHRNSQRRRQQRQRDRVTNVDRGEPVAPVRVCAYVPGGAPGTGPSDPYLLGQFRGHK